MSERYSLYLQQRDPVHVGTLWLNRIKGKISSAFVYAPDWLVHPGRFAISPDLPLDQFPKTREGLFLCLQDCSPDRWGQALLRRQELALAESQKRKPRTLLSSDMLLLVSDFTRQGALRLLADDGKTFLSPSGPNSVPPLVALPRLLHAAHNMETRSETSNELALLVAPGSSLGGARPKASVLGDKGELLIAKFPGCNDSRDVPLWEYVTLRLASLAGIRTPHVRLLRVAGKNVLLVSRFDRVFDCEGERRIPFLSAMSLLQARDGDHASYADIADALQAEGARPASDLPELWMRMVFNMCVYNTDDHLRNHGLLREPLGWRLSPVYDLEISHPAEKAPFLHTGIVPDMQAFDLNAALEAADFFRLGKSEATERMARIRKAVSHWKEEATRAGAQASEIRLMQESFEYL